ncbi:MAG: shikimate kinase [Dehalococcoidia bacterium]|nr:shikimate kinase [Dehalococcoidia bacterium]MSQ17458.1 shikimate kinase [Dehalococcoidia bacterium]
MTRPQNIILVGFMGSGKSRVGRELARSTGWPLVDTDAEAQRRAGKPIHRIFAEDGEAAFRALERQVVAQACQESGQIIAMGGGAFLDPEGRRLMLERGLVFCLSARPETLLRRVAGGLAAPASRGAGDGGSLAESRPLLAGPPAERLARIQALLAQRAEVYAQAHHTVETDHLAPEQTAQRVLELCGMGADT